MNSLTLAVRISVAVKTKQRTINDMAYNEDLEKVIELKAKALCFDLKRLIDILERSSAFGLFDQSLNNLAKIFWTSCGHILKPFAFAIGQL